MSDLQDHSQHFQQRAAGTCEHARTHARELLRCGPNRKAVGGVHGREEEAAAANAAHIGAARDERELAEVMIKLAIRGDKVLEVAPGDLIGAQLGQLGDLTRHGDGHDASSDVRDVNDALGESLLRNVCVHLSCRLGTELEEQRDGVRVLGKHGQDGDQRDEVAILALSNQLVADAFGLLAVLVELPDQILEQQLGAGRVHDDPNEVGAGWWLWPTPLEAAKEEGYPLHRTTRHAGGNMPCKGAVDCRARVAVSISSCNCSQLLRPCRGEAPSGQHVPKKRQGPADILEDLAIQGKLRRHRIAADDPCMVCGNAHAQQLGRCVEVGQVRKPAVLALAGPRAGRWVVEQLRGAVEALQAHEAGRRARACQVGAERHKLQGTVLVVKGVGDHQLAHSEVVEVHSQKIRRGLWPIGV